MSLRPTRRSHCERLENRQLLAGDFCLATDTVPTAAEGEPSLISASDQGVLPPGVLGFDAAKETTFGPLTDVAGDAIAASFAESGIDLLVENGGYVAAYRSDLVNANDPTVNDSGVYLLRRDDGGNLVEVAVIDVQFTPRRLLLTERSLFIVGHSETNRTLTNDPTSIKTSWLSVNLDAPTVRETGTIQGLLSGVARGDGRLYVSALRLQEVLPDVFPPPSPSHTLLVFDTSGDVAEPVATGSLRTGITDDAVVGDEIIVTEPLTAATTYPIGQWGTTDYDSTLLPYTIGVQYQIARYRFEGGHQIEAGRLEFERGLDIESSVAEDGKTAVIVASYSNFTGNFREPFQQPTTLVHLIDLSGETPELFQTIPVAERIGKVDVEIGERAVVIAQGTNRLFVIDTNQNIDVEAEQRVSLIEYGALGTLSAYSPISVQEISRDRYLVSRPIIPNRSTSPDAGGSQPTTMQLSVFSLQSLSFESTAETQAGTLAVWVDGQPQPQIIQLKSGYVVAPLKSQLQVVRVAQDGSLSTGESVSLGGVFEVDADADRLLLRYRDRLVEYRWDAWDDPTEAALGEPLPTITAVDDVFRRNADSRDFYLDVLANDQYVEILGGQLADAGMFNSSDFATVVELIDAPEGVRLSGGRYVMLDRSLLQSGESFQFQYVLQQFNQRSAATVEVSPFRFGDDQIDTAVDGLVQTVAEQLSVPVDAITIGQQLNYTAEPMPRVIDDQTENPLGGAFGAIVDLNVAGRLYRYATDFEGNVAELTQRELATVMALQLEAVDGNGQPIETLRAGDEFFLQVVAEDLRLYPAGVFGVAFDLPIPPAHLELTGAVAVLGRFDQLGDHTGESGIDDFMAFENLIEHTGNAVEQVVRFGVRAIAGGDVSLQLAPANRVGAELLLRGRNTEVSPLEVQFGSLDLAIEGVRPTDIDGSGRVTPLDALRVINFLSRHGIVEVDRLPELLGVEPEDQSTNSQSSLQAMRRLDINADRVITPRDALLVINEVAREAARPTVLATLEGEKGEGGRIARL